MQVAHQVGGGPHIVGTHIGKPVTELLPPTDVDQREAILEESVDLTDAGVAADENGAVGELEPAERALPARSDLGPGQAGEQQVVTLGGGFLFDPD
jgi:hypothetical protein